MDLVADYVLQGLIKNYTQFRWVPTKSFPKVNITAWICKSVKQIQKAFIRISTTLLAQRISVGKPSSWPSLPPSFFVNEIQPALLLGQFFYIESWSARQTLGPKTWFRNNCSVYSMAVHIMLTLQIDSALQNILSLSQLWLRLVTSNLQKLNYKSYQIFFHYYYHYIKLLQVF